MRAMAVEVISVDLEDGFQIASGEDQRPVGKLAADAADPAFGEGIGLRSPDRCPHHGDAGRCEDVVEGAGELAVAVTASSPPNCSPTAAGGS